MKPLKNVAASVHQRLLHSAGSFLILDCGMFSGHAGRTLSIQTRTVQWQIEGERKRRLHFQNRRMRNGTSQAEYLTLLNVRRLPARLNTLQAALLLGFQEHDLSAIIAAGLLKPLSSPASNAPKYFASTNIEAFAGDEKWLDRVTRAFAKYWSEKNDRRKTKSREEAAGVVPARVLSSLLATAAPGRSLLELGS